MPQHLSDGIDFLRVGALCLRENKVNFQTVSNPSKQLGHVLSNKVNLTPQPRVHCPFRLITSLFAAIIFMQPSIDAAYPSQIRGVVLKFKHLVSAH